MCCRLLKAPSKWFQPSSLVSVSHLSHLVGLEQTILQDDEMLSFSPIKFESQLYVQQSHWDWQLISGEP